MRYLVEAANSLSKMEACNPHKKCCENHLSHNAMSFMEIQTLRNWSFRAGKTDLKMVRDQYKIVRGRPATSKSNENIPKVQ